MSAIIKVEGLSKKFIIGHEQKESYTALRDVIAKKAKGMLSLGKKERTTYSTEEFWALKDINFEINQGDRVGIIGRNGAGKSTLLKVLSRITEPSAGRITINGRIASLLEVGTGFHPELSGRENIYLNGAILGMSRSEIKNKFDEIVAFAEVEKFLDTPVKRFSSGMYVRLAFAVAAHLEPEILIVDEVLAVGDAQFQKKCLGKMEDVSKNEGRTVLFVSHNMQTISTLTNTCLMLRQGRLILNTDTQNAISEYVKESQSEQKDYKATLKDPNTPHVVSVEMKTSLSNGVHVHEQPCVFEVELFTPRPLTDAAVSIQIFNQYDVAVTHFWMFDTELKVIGNKTGRIRMQCKIPNLMLFMGQYKATVYFSEHSGSTRLETLRDICPFEIVMYGKHRDHEWQEGTSVYLDEFGWDLID